MPIKIIFLTRVAQALVLAPGVGLPIMMLTPQTARIA